MRAALRLAIPMIYAMVAAASVAGSLSVWAQSRTYSRTVTAEESSGARRQVWTLGVARRDNILATSLRATTGPNTCEGVIETTYTQGRDRASNVAKVDGFTLKMKCPDLHEVEVRSGKVVRETAARRTAVRRELEQLSATLDGYDRPGSTLRLTAKGDDGGQAINWACEKASLKAMVSCTINPLGCGDDVEKQFCACAPKVPNAPPCGT
jgi:hypothetical protein